MNSSYFAQLFGLPITWLYDAMDPLTSAPGRFTMQRCNGASPWTLPFFTRATCLSLGIRFYVHVYMYVSTCICTHIHTCIYIYIYIYICMRAYTHTLNYTYVCTYTRTHTDIWSEAMEDCNAGLWEDQRSMVLLLRAVKLAVLSCMAE